MPTTLPRLLILPALAALLVLAMPTSPASAGGDMCPCWPGGVPLANPLVCYAAPGAQTNTFAYVPPFLQATDFWCRNNASFAWTSAAQSAACDESLQCLCDQGATEEVICNEIDDDCNPATSDEPPAVACPTGLLGVCADGIEGCDAGGEACIQVTEATDEICGNGLDDDCDGMADSSDGDCDPCLDVSCALGEACNPTNGICEPVPCPCLGLAIPGLGAWNSSLEITSCGGNLSGVIGAYAPDPGVTISSGPVAGSFCGLRDDIGFNTPAIFGLTPDQLFACNQSIRDLAAEDGVACP